MGRSESRAVTTPVPSRPSDTLPHPAARGMGEGRGGGLDRRATFRWLYLPPLLWLGLFFLIPLSLMAAFSFRANIRGNLLQWWTPTLAHYTSLAATGSYWRLLGISALMAFGVATIAVILAYPVAYFLAFRAGRRAGLYLVLLLIPFWTSYLLRVMAWKLMLGTEGVINSFLQYVGLIQEPLTALLYNRNAVVVTLIYVWIPFATLPILAALQRIEPNLFEAAADLGARPFQQFRRITLPLSLSGVFGAFFMVFIPTIGEYVTPLLVGGSRGSMYGNIIQDFFTKAANWPLGSALSMVMLVTTLLLVFIATRIINIRDLLE
ncbi:MAG TPA: ABC transporter permease [Anaerolineales bacterium]|nr:ABC transporter permease [Anaerolineales bacterium]